MTRRHFVMFLSGLLLTGCAGVPRRPPSGPPPMTGGRVAELAHLDGALARFVATHHAPGAALAVAYEGRLVYARGIGWADREEHAPVRPTSLFRIASISKPFTATAVLQLAERGQLDLDASVFDLLDIEPHLSAGSRFDARIRGITVYHCLTHTAGWDREAEGLFDPLNETPAIAGALGISHPPGPADVIRYMWGRPLDFVPGARFAYASFGYLVLGQVIEAVTGEPYADYVEREVLATLGISGMRLGGGSLAARAPEEVRYYVDDLPEDKRNAPSVIPPVGAPVLLPYGTLDLHLRQANGGWLASAVDLVRFASAFREPGACPVLTADGLRRMFTRPPISPVQDDSGGATPVYYGCGWSVRPYADGSRDYWHLGSFFGCSAMVLHRRDGVTAAVLFNQQTGNGGTWLAREFAPALSRALDLVDAWPEADLFPGLR